jgi:hypothetical protein
MKNNTTLVVLAIMASLGLVTAIAVNIILTAQEAEARGCNRSIAANASRGRCIQSDVQSVDQATIEDQVEGEENEAATIEDQVEGEEGEDDQDEEDDNK